jgi:predicted nucleotidyltransferase
MTSNQVVVEIARALKEEGVPYMLVGSYSSNMYSIPRSTQDADFVIQLATTSIGAIAGRLGPGFELDPQMTFETVTGTMRYKVAHSDTSFTVELFLLGDDVYDRTRFSRRAQRPFEETEVYVASAEDVIINKLRWHRRKDAEDIANVIAMSGDLLDWEYIHHWCDVHGTRELLASVIAAIPKR